MKEEEALKDNKEKESDTEIGEKQINHHLKEKTKLLNIIIAQYQVRANDYQR